MLEKLQHARCLFVCSRSSFHFLFVNNILTKKFHKENQLAKAFVCVIRVILKKKKKSIFEEVDGRVGRKSMPILSSFRVKELASPVIKENLKELQSAIKNT